MRRQEGIALAHQHPSVRAGQHRAERVLPGGVRPGGDGEGGAQQPQIRRRRRGLVVSRQACTPSTYQFIVSRSWSEGCVPAATFKAPLASFTGPSNG